jgi:hypothetical protein
MMIFSHLKRYGVAFAVWTWLHIRKPIVKGGEVDVLMCLHFRFTMFAALWPAIGACPALHWKKDLKCIFMRFIYFFDVV